MGFVTRGLDVSYKRDRENDRLKLKNLKVDILPLVSLLRFFDFLVSDQNAVK